MIKLFRVVLVSGIALAAACGGDPVPPKGTLNCDGGRCRDGGADLRVDRAPGALDAGASLDGPARQDSRPIVDLAVSGETPIVADAPWLPDTADAAIGPEVGRPDVPAADILPVVDVATEPVGQADAPTVADVPADAPMAPETSTDTVDAPPVTTEVAIDTTPALDVADDTADGAPDTVAVDTEPDTTPACAGVLCDDFEDGDATGWTIVGDGAAGDWAVVLDGANHVFQQSTDVNATFRLARAGQVSWTDQTVKVRLKVVSYGAAANANRALVCGRTVSAGSAYCLAISADGGGTLTMLKRRPQGGGSWDVLGTPVTGLAVATGTWHTVQLVISGASPVTLTAYLDPSATPTPTLSASDSTQTITAGNAALGTEGAESAFDDVLVTTP